MNFHLLNFLLNKFLPFFIIAFLCFLKMGFNCFEPYVIMSMCFFTSHFHFKTGYALAFCEANGISTVKK